MAQPPLYTIGHSTRSLDDFLALLRGHSIRTLADVRTVPQSRRNPQFGRQALAGSLDAAGVRYVHLPELGGLRRPLPDSPNHGWRKASFRGYADYLATEAFEGGLRHLLALAEQGALAMMCAEAVPWRCHRSLIADALLVRGQAVEHIVGLAPTRPHVLTSFVRVDGERLTYPAPQAGGPGLVSCGPTGAYPLDLPGRRGLERGPN